MLLVIFRTLLVYALVITAMRLMGKKQLGELQPSELASTILISNLASISIEAPELPFFSGMLPVFLIVACEIALSSICAKYPRAARIVSGAPRVLVQNGIINQTALAELRFSADDLLEALRSKDIFEIEDVALAIVETNGTISVQKSFAASEAANESFDFAPPKAKCPSLPVVIDGVLCRDNMKLYGVDEAFINAQCKREKCTADGVLMLLCNDAHETLLIKKECAG